jgi:hypothetical protein
MWVKNHQGGGPLYSSHSQNSIFRTSESFSMWLSGQGSKSQLSEWHSCILPPRPPGPTWPKCCEITNLWSYVWFSFSLWYKKCIFLYMYCNVDAQSISRQRLDKHVPVNTQQWKLCWLWAMLRLVARWCNNADNGWECFLYGPRRDRCYAMVQ